MKDTSLNLIAVTIFLLTLSALVGPSVGISPFVPAGMVFGLMALATLDNFALEGQGTAILSDWLVGSSTAKQDRILHHEAGHFLIAHLLNIPIEGYALNAWEAFRQGQKAQGGVRFNDQTVLGQLQRGELSSQLLDQYCKVWMAGIAAEKLVYDKAEGGFEDRQKIRSVWTQLKRPLSEAETKERWAILQARSLIENHRPKYDALVTAMAQRTSVEACCNLLNGDEFKGKS
ncbi:MAG: ATP-dependent Zn protease [Microcoleaceae cyanobacterium]